MIKTKWLLIFLGVMDLVLVAMLFTDYFFVFLLPTGYIIPIIINLTILFGIGFRRRLPIVWTSIGLLLSIPIILPYGFMVWIMDSSYTTIYSPHNQQSLVIEYRHAALGEINYFYKFYKTNLGLVGKRLDDQAISMTIPSSQHPPGLNDAEAALGLDNEIWFTENAVRFNTWQGVKEVYLNSSESPLDIENTKEITGKVTGEVIEEFIDMAENKEDGQTITINGNLLTIRHDEEADQNWIDILEENDNGKIPRQQCSRIVPNVEQGFYMLEECFHRWEYPLYPMR